MLFMDDNLSARSGVEADLECLSAELAQAFQSWRRRPEPWECGRSNELACRAFAVQYAGNAPYRLYCDRLGVSPADVDGWRDVPAVPTAAFRQVPLFVGDPAEASLEFRTSGTTRGPGRRGRHLVRDPELYRASLEAAFHHFVLKRAGGDAEGMLVASLVPPFCDAPDSSLSWMADAVVSRFGRPGSTFLASARAIDWPRAERFVTSAAAAPDAVPVCLFGTTLAFAEWLRRLEESGLSVSLPEGSIAMDTGGSKGRDGPSRERVMEGFAGRLGIAPSSAINEFGMTELLSQRYAPLAPGAGGGERRDDSRPGESGGPPPLRGPPWLLSRALHPETLEELPEGEVGVLNHFDLANVGSVCSVLTEDLGAVRENAVRWVGRSPGAPPRGCSLATTELLRAQAGQTS